MKKYVCIFLSILLCFPSLWGFSASCAQLTQTKVYTLQRDGLYTYWTDDNGKAVTLDHTAASVQPVEDVAGTLPASYYAKNVTSVKDQDPTAACWTYSVLSVLESSYINRGFGSVNNTDFSEAHLTWFANNGYYENANDPTAGDGTFFDNPYDAGGSFSMAIYALARGAGITTEAKYPMNNKIYPQYTHSQMYVTDVRIENAYYLSDQNDIKQAIMDNGGVAVCYYHSDDACKTVRLANKNPVTGQLNTTRTAYYQHSSLAPNHAVTIVGWDDSFARSNFNLLSRPSEAGAWLCKNSWGTDFGDNGYFWISYEDASLCDYTTLTAAKADLYDSVSQYDGYGYNKAVEFKNTKAAYIANVFTAQKNSTLSHIGFYTLSSDTDYTVLIYRHVNKNSGDPTDGTLAYSMSAHAEFAGYHTIPLGQKVSVQKGETYSAVIAYPLSDGESVCIPAEGKTVTSDGITTHFAAEEKCSYTGSVQNGKVIWTDAVKDGYNNVCLKAMLQDTVTALPAMQEPTTLTDLATGVQLTYDASDFEKNASVSMTVSANNSAAKQAEAHLQNLHPDAKASAYTITLYVNGKAVSTAEHGFIVHLPPPQYYTEKVLYARLTNNNNVCLSYTEQAKQNDPATIQTHTADAVFLQITLTPPSDIPMPSDALIAKFLNAIIKLFEKMIALFDTILIRS